MTETYYPFNYIADGHIHILDDKYAYMLVYTDESMELTAQDPVLNYIFELFSKRYSEYLQKNGENPVDIKYLDYSQNYQLVYRPSYMGNPLKNKGSMALKFKRLPNDGLDS